ncbi:HNH endonuclease signature motif containing protein [Streptomyces sp. IB201691-2A2]|uniref:HNH endonuclease signature motif containing protein n=1 Tax=Streptomyces sp. IB201691-2A2 TaxID=2561920 RepID=UPI0021B1238A|nr:HNH endonuclease signature motif containing protein [Streptomyces sp. IB201691-2A2]
MPVSTGVAAESLDAWAALLREQAPCGETAASLVDLKCEWLSPRGRIDALAVVERHLAWLQAKQVELLTAISDHTEGPPLSSDGPAVGVGADMDAVFLGEWDCAVEEVACALKLANSTAAQRLETARLLTGRHPATLGLLADGEISYQQARVVAEQCAVLAVDVAGEVERALVERMPEQAAGQTRAAVRRQVHRVDPAGAEARHQERLRERKLLSYPQEDGMALFGAVLPAQRAALMEQVVEAYAVGYGDDGRTLDQKRADALYDLVVEPRAGVLESGGGAAAVVHVTVPLDVLMGVDDGPGELKGYGPVTAGQVREIAFAAGTVWRRLLVQPASGLLVKTDPLTYKPTAETARHVVARDQYCAFPSCRMPARRCDLDHVRPFDHARPERGGPTTPENLQPLCRRHHRLKTHHPGWRVARDAHTGAAVWTAPTGHTYINTPPVYRE